VPTEQRHVVAAGEVARRDHLQCAEKILETGLSIRITIEEWEALDKRLNGTPVGRLLQEYHELSENLQDLLDQDEDGWSNEP
jgi:hypothetical protein